jgi:hypothetical protein
MSNVIPWSRIWKSNSPPRLDEKNRVKAVPTPQGGLMLHWIFSVIFIIASSRITNAVEAISFSGNIQAYAGGYIGGMMNQPRPMRAVI